MNTAADLFAFADAKRLRDEGMALAAAAQGQRWSDLAYAAIEKVAMSQIHVHIDDVIRAGVPQPGHPNAWGTVWLRAIRNNVIQRTKETKPCTTDKHKHAHRYPVYFSLVFDPRLNTNRSNAS